MYGCMDVGGYKWVSGIVVESEISGRLERIRNPT